MAASFLRPLLPPKPFLSASRPHLPAAAPTISTTTVRCTAAPKPATTSTPKPSQEEAVSRELQQVPNGAATPDEANANPNSIPDEETPAAAAATTSFAVARRVPSAISPGRRRRTALTQEEPPNYEIGWKRTKELPVRVRAVAGHRGGRGDGARPGGGGGPGGRGRRRGARRHGALPRAPPRGDGRRDGQGRRQGGDRQGARRDGTRPLPPGHPRRALAVTTMPSCRALSLASLQSLLS
ncbi:hypothetical protein PVAP13_5KG432200 [Panicum virgatum]|uniref:Uncharacterized protein n=1 Tax=Panicum virgatum TaxID=38727 RepID=A0A8T0SNP8_PANVG|nr:hypothetical protein PVAP13_5KG432200 [Panicum virgatum]